jgi:mediator of RNA polymerase II transcription subunit 14
VSYGGGEGYSVVLPLVYDVSTNMTQLAEKRDAGPASATAAASLQLKRFMECSGGVMESSLYPAVRDLLSNLSLPGGVEPSVGHISPMMASPDPTQLIHSPAQSSAYLPPPHIIPPQS